VSDWNHEIKIGPAFDPGDFIEYSEQAFLVHRDRVVKILKASAWLRDSQYSWTLADYVIDMAGSQDIQEFDTVMDGIYDIADDDRCWVRSEL
jgi:hypothetical protein